MKSIWKRRISVFLFLCMMLGCSIVLSGCHGARGLDAFVIPEEFSMDEQYEITFWAKNDTNKLQTEISAAG